jgi:hypothetical protein
VDERLTGTGRGYIYARHLLELELIYERHRQGREQLAITQHNEILLLLKRHVEERRTLSMQMPAHHTLLAPPSTSGGTRRPCASAFHRPQITSSQLSVADPPSLSKASEATPPRADTVFNPLPKCQSKEMAEPSNKKSTFVLRVQPSAPSSRPRETTHPRTPELPIFRSEGSLSTSSTSSLETSRSRCSHKQLKRKERPRCECRVHTSRFSSCYSR